MNLLNKNIVAFLPLLLVWSSCSPDKGTPPIDKKEMVSLLVDVHLAEATITRQTTIPADKLKRDVYYKSVLDKHGITEAQFDSAVAWYARNTMDYKKVYKAVGDTLQKLRRQY